MTSPAGRSSVRQISSTAPPPQPARARRPRISISCIAISLVDVRTLAWGDRPCMDSADDCVYVRCVRVTREPDPGNVVVCRQQPSENKQRGRRPGIRTLRHHSLIFRTIENSGPENIFSVTLSLHKKLCYCRGTARSACQYKSCNYKTSHFKMIAIDK